MSLGVGTTITISMGGEEKPLLATLSSTTGTNQSIRSTVMSSLVVIVKFGLPITILFVLCVVFLKSLLAISWWWNFNIVYVYVYAPISRSSWALMHVPTQRGPRAAHSPSGRKLSAPSFPPREPHFKVQRGRIVLAYGCVNDLLGISRPGGRSRPIKTTPFRQAPASFHDSKASEVPAWESRGRPIPQTRPLTLFLSAKPQVRGGYLKEMVYVLMFSSDMDVDKKFIFPENLKHKYWP